MCEIVKPGVVEMLSLYVCRPVFRRVRTISSLLIGELKLLTRRAKILYVPSLLFICFYVCDKAEISATLICELHTLEPTWLTQKEPTSAVTAEEGPWSCSLKSQGRCWCCFSARKGAQYKGENFLNLASKEITTGMNCACIQILEAYLCHFITSYTCFIFCRRKSYHRSSINKLKRFRSDMCLFFSVLVVN